MRIHTLIAFVLCGLAAGCPGSPKPYAGYFDVTATNGTNETLPDGIHITFDDGFQPVASPHLPGQKGTEVAATQRVPEWASVLWVDSSGNQFVRRLAVRSHACAEFAKLPSALEFRVLPNGQAELHFWSRNGEFGEREVCGSPPN